jgi:hypothetical protein
MSTLPPGTFRRTVRGTALADFVYIASSSHPQKKRVLLMNAFYPTPSSDSYPAALPLRKHKLSTTGALEAHAAFPSESFDLSFVLCVPQVWFNRIGYPTISRSLSNDVKQRFSMYEMAIPFTPAQREGGEKEEASEEGEEEESLHQGP